MNTYQSILKVGISFLILVYNGQNGSGNVFNYFTTALAGLWSDEGETDVNVAKSLVQRFGKDEEKITDLTAADELGRGLLFDQFDEKISCTVSRGILLSHYPNIVENFGRRFSLPHDVKSTLLNAQYMDDLGEIVQNFKFQKGETGSYIYGRVATAKHGEKIDIAFSVYALEFKVSPHVTKHEQDETFLWFTTGKKIWYDSEERNLSTKDRDDLQNYLMFKAITRFRSEYAGMIEASQYCDTHNCY